MDLLTLGKIMLRRWPYVLAVLLLAGATVFGLIERSTPSYEAQASMILLVPSGPEGSNVNPYAELTKPLTTTAQALALALNGPETHERIIGSGGNADFSVDAAADSPILGITVESSKSAEDTLGTMDLVVSEVSGELERWQTNVGVTEEQQFQADVLTRDNVATGRTGARDRMIAGVLFLGMIAAAGAAVLAENVARGRAAAELPIEALPPSARSVFFAGTSTDGSTTTHSEFQRPPAASAWMSGVDPRSDGGSPPPWRRSGAEQYDDRSSESVPLPSPDAGLG